jgi:TolA-binding protein
MTDDAEPERDALDLVVRARRNALSTAESNAFAQAVGTSASVRTAYEIGSDLDLATRVRPGDEALLERALTRTFAESRPLRRRRLPRVAAALAATLALASAAAATRQVIEWRAEARSAEVARVATVERASSNRAPGAGGPSAASPSAAALHDGATRTAPAASLEAEPSAPPALADGKAAPAPLRQATAASLFRDAGAARRAGDLARARALYTELESRFPGSSEARVSRVSLGKLLLSAGHAREAETAFAQYLRSGASDLREEALVGRADALRALGRSADERRARLDLIRRYPASVYANRTRERIAELDADAPSR